MLVKKVVMPELYLIMVVKPSEAMIEIPNIQFLADKQYSICEKNITINQAVFPLIRLISIIKFLRIFPRFSVSVILPRKYRKGCLIQTILFEPTGKTSLKPNAEIPSALQTSL